MAGIVEVLLKIIGDSRDAERKLDDTGRKADQTKAKVDEVDQAVIRTSTRATRLAGAITQAVGRGSAAFAAAEFIGQTIDDLLGASGRIARGERAVAQAANIGELGGAFQQAVRGRVTSFGETGGIPGLLKNVVVTLGRRIPGGAFDPGIDYKGEREALEFFRSEAASNPDRARAFLTADLGKYNYLKPQFARILTATTQTNQAAKAFQESLKQPTATNVVNVYTSIYAGGGRGTTGRQITAATNIRDRNNGRYVTTTRRG